MSAPYLQASDAVVALHVPRPIRRHRRPDVGGTMLGREVDMKDLHHVSSAGHRLVCFVCQGDVFQRRTMTP
ncbi:MAG: hypothetical protein U0R80_10385 [Nocardioidaceae bacterium]